MSLTDRRWNRLRREIAVDRRNASYFARTYRGIKRRHWLAVRQALDVVLSEMQRIERRTR